MSAARAQVTVTAENVPTWRGRLHAYAFWFALTAAAVLVALAPSSKAQLASAVYGVGLCALFAVSGLYQQDDSYQLRDLRYEPGSDGS